MLMQTIAHNRKLVNILVFIGYFVKIKKNTQGARPYVRKSQQNFMDNAQN